MCSRIIRAKQGWHMPRAAFAASRRITPPHHAHKTSAPSPRLDVLISFMPFKTPARS
jgi:hypothetical protein